MSGEMKESKGFKWAGLLIVIATVCLLAAAAVPYYQLSRVVRSDGSKFFTMVDDQNCKSETSGKGVVVEPLPLSIAAGGAFVSYHLCP